MKLLYIALIALVFAAIYLAYVQLSKETAERERISSIEITDVDFSSLPDGVYYGECRMQAVAARVRVTVSGARVISVELLEHDSERGAEAEVIPAVVVAQQNLNVEAVTGATLSSKVILKAVERAATAARRSCEYESAA